MSEIKPALTAEEWATTRLERVTSLAQRLEWASGETDGVSRHGLAALALYNQPFGFTREDVEALESAADSLTNAEDADPFTYQEAGRLHAIAARIKDLLPPEQ